MKYLDTNIILRLLTRDDEAKAAGCHSLFQQAEGQGKQEVATTEAIITEVCYVLSSSRNPYKLTHEEIRARLVPVLSMRGLRLPRKRRYLRALDLYATYPVLDIEDAVCVAHMEAEGISEILSYDTDFDDVEEAQRVEP